MKRIAVVGSLLLLGGCYYAYPYGYYPPPYGYLYPHPRYGSPVYARPVQPQPYNGPYSGWTSGG
jgi:hypothetical protein